VNPRLCLWIMNGNRSIAAEGWKRYLLIDSVDNKKFGRLFYGRSY
jgi:hypothetical protein